ncbi:hypothetical protein H9L01_04895 [Erysipelothrix inopinata]|uniref:Uncharacterized protein n=1 Tax=Erysipelothrix inopinata TaxID=225084 RepID=A0A7G9S1H1_9FIRM|nr:hypothetical protein [Erysipelothrix inopinata]QNN61696.1 hypothetical protein H9L01_04895 [Erysipelothrix inopinata]
MIKVENKKNYKIINKKLEESIAADETCVKIRKLLKKLVYFVLGASVVMVIVLIASIFLSGVHSTMKLNLQIIIGLPVSFVILGAMLQGIYREGAKACMIYLLFQGVYGIMGSLNVIRSGNVFVALMIGWILLIYSVTLCGIGVFALLNKDVKYLNQFVKTERKRIEEDMAEEI